MLLAGFKVLFNYPAWYFVLCLLCGGAYAAILYYANRSDGFSGLLRWALGLLRFLSVSILAFLLLAPLLERMTKYVEDPILIYVQDQSHSVIMGAPPGFSLSSFSDGRNQLLKALEGKYDIRTYAFGEYFRPLDQSTLADAAMLGDSMQFDDRLTNISEVFSSIEAQYSNRNIAGVILASDGLYNRGVNPVFASASATYPVFALALGDTLPRRDLVLSRLRHNRITYLGNTFPVEIHVEARASLGERTVLTVSRAGETVFSKQIAIDNDHFLETILVELEADRAGMQRYTVSLRPLENEISLSNNLEDFYIDVIDGRQSVLILAHAPHPDIGALRLALESGGNYQVSTFLFDEFSGNPDAYNLIILHQLPAAGVSMQSFMQQLNNTDVSVLYILGSKTDVGMLNSIQDGFSFELMAREMVEVIPHHDPSFFLFSIQEPFIRMLGFLPPLYAPFARYGFGASTQTLLSQKIGQVVTGNPLFAFSTSGGRKTGLIAGEGIWRWRLHTYLREGDHRLFDELISGMVQYLSIQEDKSLFRLKHPKVIFEHETVTIDAELYNRSYELNNEPEVTLTITNEEGASFPYVMARTVNAYTLHAGTFPPGNYSVRATARMGGEVLQAEGMFSISPLNFEDRQLIANHNLLFQIADHTGGALFFPGQWEELRNHLMNRDDLRSVMFTRQSLDELIHIKWIFFIILMLLSLEWFIRKRAGNY